MAPAGFRPGHGKAPRRSRTPSSGMFSPGRRFRARSPSIHRRVVIVAAEPAGRRTRAAICAPSAPVRVTTAALSARCQRSRHCHRPRPPGRAEEPRREDRAQDTPRTNGSFVTDCRPRPPAAPVVLRDPHDGRPDREGGARVGGERAGRRRRGLGRPSAVAELPISRRHRVFSLPVTVSRPVRASGHHRHCSTSRHGELFSDQRPDKRL